MTTRLHYSASCFCGRTAELTAAEDFLVAQSAAPVILTVSGDPGIGKSHMMTVLAERLLDRGWTGVDDATASAIPYAHRLRDQTGRTLLAIDDAHRLDAAQVRELAGLLRRPPVDRPSVALLYRRGQLPPALAAAVTAGAANPILRMELSPLPYADVADLLVDLHGPEVARGLYDAGEGNPLYLTILSARQRSVDVDDALAALRLEVTECGVACEVVAAALAVWGTSMDPAAAAEVSGLSPEAAETAIDDLLRSGVLRRSDTGLAFRHDLLRQAVEQSIGWQTRRTTHSRAADLRRRRGEPVDTWATHVQLSASVGDLRAARWLTQAAAAVRLRSAELAADWYLAALRLIPESSASSARRGRLLLGQAEALTAAGRFIEGREAVHQALQLLPRHGWRVLRTALMVAAFAERCLGRFEEAIALLTRARDLAQPCEVASALADVHILMGEFAAAAHYAEQAESTQDSPVDDAHLGAQTGTLAVARYLSGDIAAAQRLTQDMGKLIDAAADHELIPLMPALSWLGWTDMFLGHHREAELRQGRAVALARRTRHHHSLIMLLAGRGTALRHLGRLDEAGKCYDEAHTAAVVSGSDLLTILTLTMQARLAQSRGDVDAALGLAKTAADIGRRAPGWFAAHAAALYAQIRLDSGDAEDCVDDILLACGGRDLIRIDPASRPHWFEVLCRASLASDDLHGAREWADRARRAADTLKLPAAYGYSLLATEHVAAAQGRRQEAELERLQERDAQRPDSGPLATLTRRERQVAELVAAGHTNRQIASDLYLSVKTVERHLARIFTRLDISSRAKLAAMVATDAN